MKFLFGTILFIGTLIETIFRSEDQLTGTIGILIALCLFIVKERFLDKPVSAMLYAFVLTVLSTFYSPALLLFGIVLLDLFYYKQYLISGLISTALFYVTYQAASLNLMLIYLIGGLFGYMTAAWTGKVTQLRALLDSERSMRYQLEKTHQEMIHLKNEIEYITEIKERNRIAQEIHDSIGHGIAGVLLQLRAAQRSIRKDTDKTEAILKVCTDNLAETLETTRKTVYNIRSDQTTGIDFLQKVIQSFDFCPVDFQHNGNFNALSPSTLKALEATTKELLTNAMKYSEATAIQITIEVMAHMTRYYYKDNGKGCGNVLEGVGLSSIKDRVANLGGTYAYDGSSGFMVVCTFPMDRREDAYEGSFG